MSKGENVWKKMIGELSEKLRSDFPFNFLKTCTKILAYKSLQGGNLGSLEKIYKSLKEPEKVIGKSLYPLAQELSQNKLLSEFNCINKENNERIERLGFTKVYTPMDEVGYGWSVNPRADDENRTSNRCRITSQVVVGVEVMQLLALIEGIIELRLPWLPISLHHDGFALIAMEATLEEGKKSLEEYISKRMTPVGFKNIELEFTPYNESMINLDELSEIAGASLPDGRFI